MTENNNRQTASDRRIADLPPQPSRSGNLHRTLIDNNNNNNNNNLALRGNTDSYTNFNNFKKRTGGQRNRQSPANPSNLNPNVTNFLIHSRPSPHNSRFAALHSSPVLIDTSNTISVATLNVRSISKSTKFDALFDDIFDASLSIIGLQETRISEAVATSMFKDHVARKGPTYPYHAYWSFDPSDRAGGVSLVIASYISKYVQHIHRHKSRFIAIDLYLPARKIKVINVYCYQQVDYNAKGKTFNKFVMDHIKQAEKDNFKVIILGDFNADPATYLDALVKGTTPRSYFSLVEFLYENNYIDQHPKNQMNLEYATHYVGHKPTSRIDLIFYPDDFIINDFCFDRVWQLPFTQLATDSECNLDHHSVIVYFTKSLLISNLPEHQRKQKGIWRTYYDVKSASNENWTDYSATVSQQLMTSDRDAIYPVSSTLNAQTIILNMKWHALRNSINKAAKQHIPIKKVSPFLKQKDDGDLTLAELRSHLTSLNKIFAFLTTYTYPSKSLPRLHKLQNVWYNHSQSNLRESLIKINTHYKHLIAPASIPLFLNSRNRKEFQSLRLKVDSLRNTLRQQRYIIEQQLKKSLIKQFENYRCSNFAVDKAAFIASSLNRTKRSIVLDRAMSVNDAGQKVLLTEEPQVKDATIAYFQTIAGLPPRQSPSINNINNRWKSEYSPLQIGRAS